jgi:tRNA/tmRNA/rRNA uracil-C5-methylase (TrmA/RlmC/RlmD family)
MENWLVISTEKQAENEILRTKIEQYESVLRHIAHDEPEISDDKVKSQRDDYRTRAHLVLYGPE